MSAKKKESVYIEADEEITSVLSRIAKIDAPVIALTPAKRSETLRSLVNVKLLQRAGKKQDKRIVIISKDPVIKALAAKTGIYTAATPSSKPVLEKPPTTSSTSKPKAEAKEKEKVEEKPAPKKKTTKPKAAATTAAEEPAKKELKVPNFGVFRKRLGLTMLGIIGIPVLLFFIFRSLPSATVTISTNARQVDAVAEATLDFSEAASVDVEQGVLPAQIETSRIQITQEIIATGELNVGENATGTITVSNCTDSALVVPAQTVFSDSGLSFVSQTELNLQSGNFTGNGECKPDGEHVQTVGVVAQEPGDQYNLSARQYSSSLASGVIAQGSVMSGGSSETIAVVQQSDLDSANTLLQEKRDDSVVQNQLQQLIVSSGLLAIEDSFEVSAGTPSSDVEVDEEIGQGLLTLSIDYSLVGVQQTDVLNFLLPSLESAAGDLDLLDSGIEQTVFETTKLDDDSYSLEMSIRGSAGALLSNESVFEQIKNRKGSEAAAELRRQEGVTEVNIDTSPFWNTSIPDDINKVDIQINGQ